MGTVGVADGVGGWAKRGIDGGEYSRRLMSSALAAVMKEIPGRVDLRNVLDQAYSGTTVQGSSTACILTLKGQSLNAINVGDSGFRIIRKGSCVYRSPVQQRGFNCCPYQLGNGRDDPSMAQLLEDIPVDDGDVVVVGTDGLFDNMFDSEIELEVERWMADGVGAQDMSYRIAELALYNSFDKYTQSPYARAAKMAGKMHRGGKIDDISVIVVYIQSCCK